MKHAHIAAGIAATGALAIALGFAPQFASAFSSGAASPVSTATAAAAIAPVADGETFTIDPVHSSVMFRIEHMGVSNFYGAFKDVSGTYTLGEDPTFEITVKADSVDSRNEGRDKHLKSPDFFNAVEFPTISFKSTQVEKDGENLKVTGDLTLKGVTKPVTVTMKTWPTKETRQGVKSGFETHFNIKRTDFGMDTYVAEGGLGDEVTILIAGEGAVKKE